MSTRCNVTLYDRCDAGWKEGPMLYHHSDGYPDAMLPRLEYLLQKARKTLEENHDGVNSEKLAAMLVAGSVESDGVPAFWPCRVRHDDIDFRYDVYVDAQGGRIDAKDRNGHAVGTVVIDATNETPNGSWEEEKELRRRLLRHVVAHWSDSEIERAADAFMDLLYDAHEEMVEEFLLPIFNWSDYWPKELAAEILGWPGGEDYDWEELLDAFEAPERQDRPKQSEQAKWLKEGF